MKEKILKLKKEHPEFGYKRIAKLANCSPNLVKYHLNESERSRSLQRQSSRRAERIKQFKIKHGGKCFACGYKKYLGALHFHHLDQSQKEFKISALLHNRAIGDVEIEVKKCILLCANCHAEVHGNILKLFITGQRI